MARNDSAPNDSADGSTASLDRLVAAQQVLARVLAYERATLGDPLSSADVRRLLRGDGAESGLEAGLDAEAATRLVYELSLSGGRSWTRLQGLEAESDLLPEDSAPDNPVVAALHVLVARSFDARLGYSVRHAVDKARTRPLGFCRLVLEMADASGASRSRFAAPDPSQLAQASLLLDDPFLCRESRSAWFDLRARAAIYLVDRARREGRFDSCTAQLSSLPELLAAGTGDADLQARAEEVHAGLDLASGDRESAFRRLRRAVEMLDGARTEADAEAADHMVDLRLKQAAILAADPATRSQAAEALRDLAASFDRRPQVVDAGLRLRTFHAVARVALDIVRQKVAELQPLGADDGPRPEVGLAAYAEAWSAQSKRLERVGLWLRSAEPLLESCGGPRQHAEHRWYRGQSRLLEDRTSAARDLRLALVDFRKLGDEATVHRVSIDLIVCGVLAGALGDEVDDWSEPLRLFQQLAART